MSDLEFWLKLIALGACAIFVVAGVYSAHYGSDSGRLPKMKPAPPYEKPEDRPKPVMPPSPYRPHCTNCGHGHNIIDLSKWTGGPL